MKYRKKPIVVEATQWFKNGDHPKDDREMFDAGSGPFLGEGKVVRYYRTPELDGQTRCHKCSVIMHHHGWIDTREGGHVVCPGDWIITDERVKDIDSHGHYYPCKPDLFSQTYERARK